MALDRAKVDDQVVVENGIKILVDPNTVDYLGDTVVDYIESLNGAGFKITNSRPSSGCGCGGHGHGHDHDNHDHEHGHGHGSCACSRN